MDISLHRAASKTGRSVKFILNMIEVGILPARWTRTGWQINPAALVSAVRSVDAAGGISPFLARQRPVRIGQAAAASW